MLSLMPLDSILVKTNFSSSWEKNIQLEEIVVDVIYEQQCMSSIPNFAFFISQKAFSKVLLLWCFLHNISSIAQIHPLITFTKYIFLNKYYAMFAIFYGVHIYSFSFFSLKAITFWVLLVIFLFYVF